MAGFETIVRPAVFPNIRPAPARVLPPQQDPEKGMATIGGGGAKFMGTSHSYSMSMSRQLPQVETKRQFDTERVYQMDDKGNINKENYVDLERAYNFRFVKEEGELQSEERQSAERLRFADPPPRDNVVTLEKAVTREADK